MSGRTAILLVLSILAAVMGFVRYRAFRHDQAVFVAGKYTTGTVIDVTSGSFDRFSYRYVVSKKTYVATDAIPTREPLVPGSRIPVLYDPKDPSVSGAGNLDARKASFRNDVRIGILPIFCWWLVLCAVFWFVPEARIKRRA